MGFRRPCTIFIDKAKYRASSLEAQPIGVRRAACSSPVLSIRENIGVCASRPPYRNNTIGFLYAIIFKASPLSPVKHLKASFAIEQNKWRQRNLVAALAANRRPTAVYQRNRRAREIGVYKGIPSSARCRRRLAELFGGSNVIASALYAPPLVGTQTRGASPWYGPCGVIIFIESYGDT